MDRPFGFDYFYGVESEQFSFIRLPKLLFMDRHFEGLSLEAKVVYGLLLDRMSLSLKNGWIDEENRVYIIYTVTTIAEDIGCSKDKAGRILSELDSLKGIGLVERKRRGLGRPDIIYVKNFVKFMDDTDDKTEKSDTGNADTAAPKAADNGFSTSGYEDAFSDGMGDETEDDVDKTGGDVDKHGQNEPKLSRDCKIRLPETADHDFKKPQNTISGDRKLRLQETAKCGPNKTDINNTEYNDTSSSPRGSSRPIRLMDNRKLVDEDEEALRQIRENILYDWHMRTDSGNDKEIYQELYEVIKDMIIGKREKVRIGEATYPYSHVRQRFMTLNNEHLEYARTEVIKKKKDIYSMKSFMTAALFNAPATINTHYSHLVTYYEEGDGRKLWDAG